jgi:hypothetical protein
MNIDTPTAKPPKKRRGPAPLTDEEKAEKEAVKDALANDGRFQLIRRSSGKFGVWDSITGTILSVFHTRAEAIEELIRLKTGKAYYSN